MQRYRMKMCESGRDRGSGRRKGSAAAIGSGQRPPVSQDSKGIIANCRTGRKAIG